MSYEYQYVRFKSDSTITFPDGSNDTEFIICTQPDNLGYGASGRKIFNKALSISDISYNAENGISNLQNCKMTISNTGQFYQLMRELNGFDFWPSLQVDIYWAYGRVPTLVYSENIYNDGAVFSFDSGKNLITGETLSISGDVSVSGKTLSMQSSGDKLYFDDVLNKGPNTYTTIGMWIKPSQEWLDNNGFFNITCSTGYASAYFYAEFDYDTTNIHRPYDGTIRVAVTADPSGTNNKANRTYFDNSYFVADEWNFIILTNDNSYGDSNLNDATNAKDENYTISQSKANTDLFLFNATNGLIEFYGITIWDGSQVFSTVNSNFKINGPTWKKDGETETPFYPDETYPLIDSIKKEFSGRFDSGSISKDTATFNLVSQEKMDSYKIGTIESMFGADSSKGKINPIVIGDMTNEFAYVPVILDRSLYDVPTAICSDIDLSEQPTLHIYDDEAERYYDVLNEQTFIDNRKIAFVDDTLIEGVTAYTTGHVVMNGDISAEKILKDENGEYFGRFGDNLPYVSINKTAGGAFDYLAFIQNDYSIQRTYEGTRNYTGTIFENGKTVDSLTVSKDMAKAKALVNLEFKPVVFYNVPDEQEDFDAIASAEFYTRVTKAGGVDTAGKPYQTNAIGTGPNPNSSQQMASTGRVKDVLNYEDWESTNYPHSDVTNLEYPLSYLIFAPVHGVWSSNALDGNEYSLWSDYNYYTFSRQRLGFDLTPCKFDGDVKQFNININGGFYSKFYWGDGEPDGQKLTNSEAPAFAFSAKNENTNALDYHYIETRPITITSEFDDYSKEIKSTFQLDWFSTINGIKNSSPSIVMQGWSITSPFNVISGPRDYSRGRFGRNYFALDGVRLLAQASLNVESKYWCFKGKTASTDLITCLNELGAKYGNTTYVGTGVTGMKISGAIIGDPIYYRDVIAKIAEEFYCFVYDKNGVSYVVKKGSGADIGNIDESNIIGPWIDNISFSETPANEIYDRFVVRYNYNHMTGKYGSFLEWNPDLFSTEISSPSRVSLYEAQQYLSKIGQSGKTKTVDLQFVRDVDTAVNIGEKWVQNIVRQRPKVTINVSKNVFLNMNIGDKFYLNLDVPSFYKTYYSVTKIVNRSNKTLTIEGEAFN